MNDGRCCGFRSRALLGNAIPRPCRLLTDRSFCDRKLNSSFGTAPAQGVNQSQLRSNCPGSPILFRNLAAMADKYSFDHIPTKLQAKSRFEAIVQNLRKREL